MADTQSPPPEDMHWGISYLREDLQDIKQDMRDFRREVAAEFAAVRGEAADFRKEVAQQLRHNLTVMVGVTVGITGIFATLIIAFIQYKLPGG